MDTQRIKDLIAAKIAGQGNQVDIGNALPGILNAIVDAVADNTPQTLTLNVAISSFPVTDKAGAATALGITPEQLDALLAGAYTMVHIIIPDMGEDEYVLAQPIIPTEANIESKLHFLGWDQTNSEYVERFYLLRTSSQYIFDEM